MTTSDGGPAFAFGIVGTNGVSFIQQGMSLRDYFAGQALTGLMITEPPQSKELFLKHGRSEEEHQAHINHYVSAAYSLADAMIKRRPKS